MDSDRSPDGDVRRHFYGVAEIAGALGLNRQLVAAWRRRGSHGIPTPDAELASGPLWRGERIEPWIDALREREAAGPAAAVTPALVRRACRRVLRLLALLLEDDPRPRLIARAITEAREVLPPVDEMTGARADPLARELRRLLSPVEGFPAPENERSAGGEPLDELDSDASYRRLRAALLTLLPTLPELLAAAARNGGPDE